MLNQLLATALGASLFLGTTIHGTHAQEAGPRSYPVLSGVGLALRAKEGHIFVGKVIAKSPADESGLIRKGAQLVSVEINGKCTLLDGKTVSDAASLIREPVGTQLVLAVVPPNDSATIKVTLTRAPLEIAGLPDSTYKPLVGKLMPELQLLSLDGKPSRKLSDYLGKVVVLDFWASWCPTCYPPVTKIQNIYENNPHWKGKVELITVTVDSDLSKAVAIIDNKKWNNTKNYAVDFDDLKAVGVSVVPLVIIIAPDGTIATMAGAYALDIENEVTELLAN